MNEKATLATEPTTARISRPDSTPFEDKALLTARIRPVTKASLVALAKFKNSNTSAEVELALEAWVAQSKDDPSIKARAQKMQAEHDREMAERQAALDSLIGGIDLDKKEVKAPAKASR